MYVKKTLHSTIQQCEQNSGRKTTDFSEYKTYFGQQIIMSMIESADGTFTNKFGVENFSH